MIIEFRVKNYRSFHQEQTFNLAASNYDKSLPENVIEADLPGLSELRVVKAVAIYGPNAGGKTNVLLALRFLRWLVVESATGQKPEAKLPVEPFLLDSSALIAPTTLELTFVAEGIRYELAVAVTSQRVIQERLVAHPKGKAQLWYDRIWNEEARRYDWQPEKSAEFHRDPGIVEKTRENALFLATAAQWNNAQVAPVYKWFDDRLVFLNLDSESSLSHDFTAKLLNQSDNARELIKNALRLADLGLTDAEAKAEKYNSTMPDVLSQAALVSGFPTEHEWQITFQHAGKRGENFPITWANESAGTRHFFNMLGPWMSVIKNSQVLCVDELETSLHPSLATALLQMLFKLTHEQNRTQLLFTTHNPLLLDLKLLRRDQIWFVDKNQEGESFLYPLTDYKPRADESLVRGYLSGRYGAVPFIPHGLVGSNDPEQHLKEAANAR